jgi:16S rRNA (guanine527-N7)-methyltransferase
VSGADPAGAGVTQGPPADPPAEFAAAARTVFGKTLGAGVAFAGMLVTDGVIRGVVGPREAPRIWQRHLLNCAVLAERIPPGVPVTDVGSGAGLPGLVLAIVRPDLPVVLLEPMARRTAFLTEAVARLGLDGRVTVVRARAEEAGAKVALAEVVTARAVAPLDRLVAWCLPLVVRGGRVLAMKGSTAPSEIQAHAAVISRLGGSLPVLTLCGVGVLDPPTTVVEIVRERTARPAPPRRDRARRRPGG